MENMMMNMNTLNSMMPIDSIQTPDKFDPNSGVGIVQPESGSSTVIFEGDTYQIFSTQPTNGIITTGNIELNDTLRQGQIDIPFRLLNVPNKSFIKFDFEAWRSPIVNQDFYVMGNKPILVYCELYNKSNPAIKYFTTSDIPLIDDDIMISSYPYRCKKSFDDDESGRVDDMFYFKPIGSWKDRENSYLYIKRIRYNEFLDGVPLNFSLRLYLEDIIDSVFRGTSPIPFTSDLVFRFQINTRENIFAGRLNRIGGEIICDNQSIAANGDRVIFESYGRAEGNNGKIQLNNVTLYSKSLSIDSDQYKKIMENPLTKGFRFVAPRTTKLNSISYNNIQFIQYSQIISTSTFGSNLNALFIGLKPDNIPEKPRSVFNYYLDYTTDDGPVSVDYIDIYINSIRLFQINKYEDMIKNGIEFLANEDEYKYLLKRYKNGNLSLIKANQQENSFLGIFNDENRLTNNLNENPTTIGLSWYNKKQWQATHLLIFSWNSLISKYNQLIKNQNTLETVNVLTSKTNNDFNIQINVSFKIGGGFQSFTGSLDLWAHYYKKYAIIGSNVQELL